MNTFDSDTEGNGNDAVVMQKDGASNNEGASSSGSVKDAQSQIQASQAMPSSMDDESNNSVARANAPSPGSDRSGPSSPGFRLHGSPQNSPERHSEEMTFGSSQGRRSAVGRRSRSGSVTATPMSNVSRSFATPGQNYSNSGGISGSGSRTPLSQRGLRDRIPRGDLGHRSAVRSSARRGRHGALPPISPALPTSGVGIVDPTPPSTPGSAILSEVRAVPQSALSQHRI